MLESSYDPLYIISYNVSINFKIYFFSITNTLYETLSFSALVILM